MFAKHNVGTKTTVTLFCLGGLAGGLVFVSYFLAEFPSLSSVIFLGQTAISTALAWFVFKKSYRALWIGAFWCCAQIIEVSGDGWRFAFGAPVKFLLSWHWAGVDVAINLFAVITLFCIGYGLRTLHRLVPASKASH